MFTVDRAVKPQLGPVRHLDVLVVAYLSFPNWCLGDFERQIGSAQVPCLRSLSANWTAAGMLSLYFSTQGVRRNIIGESTFLMGSAIDNGFDYQPLQSWIMPNGVQISLSASDIQLVQAQTRDRFVTEAAQNFTLAYQSRALTGLGMVADSAGLQVIKKSVSLQIASSVSTLSGDPPFPSGSKSRSRRSAERKTARCREARIGCRSAARITRESRRLADELQHLVAGSNPKWKVH